MNFYTGRHVSNLTMEELLDFIGNKTAKDADPYGIARKEILRRMNLLVGICGQSANHILELANGFDTSIPSDEVVSSLNVACAVAKGIPSA